MQILETDTNNVNVQQQFYSSMQIVINKTS